MSLKIRLILAFSVMIVLTALMGIMLITSSWLLRSKYILYEEQRRSYDLVRSIAEKFEKQVRSLDGYLIGLDTERDHIRELELEIKGYVQEWQGLVQDPTASQDRDHITTALNSFQSALPDIYRLVEHNLRKQAVEVMEKKVLPLTDSIRQDLETLRKKKRADYNYSWDFAQKVADRVTQTSVVFLIFVVIVAGVLSFFLYHSVSHPLAQLTEGVKKIGKGEWNVKFNVNGPAELKELAKSFEEMSRSLKELQMQVVQMSRMSVVGTLAGGVAHEINNPLTGVLGQSQLILEKMSGKDPNRLAVEKIERAAMRCKKIVRGLLDFSRSQDYIFHPVNVDYVIEAALILCETQISASGVKVEWKKNPTLPKILASDNHLQQVFLNIITNSIHAMPKGGDLAITSNVSEMIENINDKQIKRECVEIQFRDNGIGIDPKDLPHLFDPFFTTKEPGQGTGLGLSISYGIIQQHHGVILAKSDGQGRGAVFSVRIPTA